MDNALEYIYALVDTEDKTWKRVDELLTADGFEEAFRVPSGDLWFASRIR